MIFLNSVSPKEPFSALNEYPFSVTALASMATLEFHSPVTFLVGENGSGKSTLLEAMAAGINLPAIGASAIDQDDSLRPARILGEKLRFSWRKRSRSGFFLRAEDFFNFTKALTQNQNELQSMADHYEKTLSGYAREKAMGVVLGQKHQLVEQYGENLDANSHGEAFLKLFNARIKRGGLYLLDEPEAPLSPQRQIAFLKVIYDGVQDGSQFVIATHSPILMAFPEATILDFTDGTIREMSYEGLEHVRITKSFLNDPKRYLAHLLGA